MSHPVPTHDVENQLEEDVEDNEACFLCGGSGVVDDRKCLHLVEAENESIGEALMEDLRGN